MTLRATKLYPLLLAVLLAGCASVPQVESRLRSMRFHPNMYVVQAGDTLETIAFRYELAVADLAALNPGLGRDGMLPAGLRINVRPGTRLADAVRAGSTPTALTASASAPATRAMAASEPAAWREQEPAYASARQPDVLEAVPNAVPRRTSDGFTANVAPLDPAPLDPWAARERVRESDARILARNEIDPRDAFPREGTRREETLRPREDAFVREEPARGGAREEILPDDYDIGDGASDPDPAGGRGVIDESLQRYVGRWTWPIDGAVARNFAPERIGGQGVDIAGVPGQEVRAAVDGTVVYSGRDLSGEGKLVILRHDDDLMTTYSHADELFVNEEERVLAGDVIASLGWNERRESVLGFEVRRDGNPLDPMAFLPPR